MAEIVESFDAARMPVPEARRFQARGVRLEAADAVTLDVRGARAGDELTIIPDATAVVTMSRVDVITSRVHGTDARLYTAPTAGALNLYALDWPFVRISTVTAGADVRVGGLGSNALFVPTELGSTLINWQGPEILDALPLGDATTWAGQAGLADMTAGTAGSIEDVGGLRVLHTDGAASEFYTVPDDAAYATANLSIGVAVHIISGGLNAARLMQGQWLTDHSWFFQLSSNVDPAFRILTLLVSDDATDATADDNGLHSAQLDTWISAIAVYDGGQAWPGDRVRYWVHGVELAKNEISDPPTSIRNSASLPRLANWQGFGAGGFDRAYWRAVLVDGQSWTPEQVARVNDYLTRSFTT